MKRQYYLIDTENVGDRWFDLLKKLNKKDRIIIFYTENHSKHLEEYLFQHIYNPNVLWLVCMSGNNALDYQLIGVLSYLIAKHSNDSFCIFSNDKDYQGTIEFWKSRGIKISRKGFETKKKKKVKKKKEKKKKQEKNTEINNQKKEAKTPLSLRIKCLQQGKLTEEQCIMEMAKCISISNLGRWYQALTAILGQEAGRNWYKKVKEDADFRANLSKDQIDYIDDNYICGVHLVAIMLNLRDLDVTRAEEAYKIIQSHSQKDMGAMKAHFDKQFGKKPQQVYYTALKPLVKVIKKN